MEITKKIFWQGGWQAPPDLPLRDGAEEAGWQAPADLPLRDGAEEAGWQAPADPPPPPLRDGAEEGGWQAPPDLPLLLPSFCLRSFLFFSSTFSSLNPSQIKVKRKTQKNTRHNFLPRLPL